MSNPAASKGTSSALATRSQPSNTDPLYTSSKTLRSHGLDTTSSDFKWSGAIQNGENLQSHESDAVEIRSSHRLSSYKSSSNPSLIVTPKPTSSVAPSTAHLPSPLSIAIAPSSNVYVYADLPPSTSELVGSVDSHAIPSKIYRDAYYSRESDAPENSREYAGLLYHLKGGEGLGALNEWDGRPTKSSAKGKAKADHIGKLTGYHYWPVTGGYEYASCPPSPREVRKWLATDVDRRFYKKKAPNSHSQVRDSLLHLSESLHLPSDRGTYAVRIS